MLAVAGGALIALVAGTGASGGESGRARVDAVFDNAAFVVPGQQVKIAGAEVGEVRDVRLAPGNRALIAMEVDRRFAPFRADADCTVQPQSLIGEKFVQCTPGTPRARPLPERGGVQTVPLRNTHSPVDLDLVLSISDLPTRQRAALLLDALGAGVAGRSRELNAVLRRANPALQATDRALRVLDANRSDLRAVISESERVVGALARDRTNVGRFLDAGADVTTTIARRRDALERTIDELPDFLDEARPTFRTFTRLADVGTPAARELRAAARPAEQLLREIPRFSADARPALASLSTTSRRSTPEVRAARPLVAQLRTFAREARPAGARVAELFTSMRDRGVVEGLQSFVYYTAAALARFDRTSHILPAFLLPETQCITYARQPVAGCSARLASAGASRAGRSRPASRGERGRPARRRSGRRERSREAASEPHARADAPGPGGAEPAAERPVLPVLPDLPRPAAPAPVPPRPAPEPRAPEPPAGGSPAEELLDFLLG